jgi:hypothetical protein
MKKQILLFILFTAVLNFSCRKEKDCSTGQPYITNPTSYILKRQTWTGPNTNGESFLYLYNADHLVSKIERYHWGTFSSNGGPIQTWYDTAYYTFGYTNGLCTKWAFDEGGSNGYYVYEYNEKKLPVKRTLYYADRTVQSYNFYKYDDAGNLVEKTDSSNKVDFKYVFTYNSSNNLVSAINYILWSNPQQKMKYEWLAFDNKVNFIKAVNGLPSTFAWDNNYHSYSSSSPNNFIAENYYTPVNMDQPFTSPSSFNYSYEYNDEGLPTKMTYGPWLVTFEYEKYK